MRPGELWAQMTGGETLVMRAALHVDDRTTLLCLRGGDAGAGEIALRLPAGTDVHHLLEPRDGLLISKQVTASDPLTQLVRIAPSTDMYRDLYTYLADDIHEHLTLTNTANTAVNAMRSRILLWAGFLGGAKNALEPRTVTGLFAELCALEQVLIPSLGWEGALLAWTGPSGTAQDIVTDRVLVDVKATRDGDSLVTVSSIEQFDTGAGRPLYLLQAVIGDSNGESLHALIGRLRASARGAGAQNLLDARLSQAGAGDAALAATGEASLSLLRWQCHRADDPGFPRLTRTGLHHGVISATYRIDLQRSTAPREPIANLVSLLESSVVVGDRP